MHPTRSHVAAAVLCALAVSSPLTAQASFFADTVVSAQTNGQSGGGIFQPQNALGAPLGGTHVHSLGIQGSLTVGFTLPIIDGPGCDLIVGENPFSSFTSFWQSFAEVCFVEVSSDGVNFARFPNRYWGPQSWPGSFGFLDVGAYSGMAGQTPVLATDPTVDARDVAAAGGDAFDLADLANHALVQAGLVQLSAITQVRLVDAESGVSLDSANQPVFDTGTGSADIDSVTAIHQQGQVPNGNPRVVLTVQADGTMTMRLEDPDGWQDLDPQSLRAALFGIPVDAGNLLGAFQVQGIDALGFTLVQPVPLPPGLLFTVSFSLKDLQGNRSGQARTRPGA